MLVYLLKSTSKIVSDDTCSSIRKIRTLSLGFHLIISSHSIFYLVGEFFFLSYFSVDLLKCFEHLHTSKDLFFDKFYLLLNSNPTFEQLILGIPDYK